MKWMIPMRLFDRKLALLLIVFCLPLMFLPKINIVKFHGETAGLRIDDFVLALVCLIVFIAHYSLRKKLLDIEIWIGCIVIFSFISLAINQILVALEIISLDAKIYYCVRLLEYFLFFYVGLHLPLFCKLDRFVKAFFLWNLLIMILQKLDLIGGIVSQGYYSVSSRITGVASFPSEMGALLNLLFCVLVLSSQEKRKVKWNILPFFRQLFRSAAPYLLFLLFAVFTIFTGSRIAIIALLVTLLYKIHHEISQRVPFSKSAAMFFLLICSFVLFHVIVNTADVFQRSAHLFSLNNLVLIGDVWKNIDYVSKPFFQDAVKMGSYDMSWWIRIQKWCYALKVYVMHPECYLQGVGPGFTTAALDGGFLRIFTEYGLVGCFLFWKLFAGIYKKSTLLQWMMIAFFFNMIFFDIYLAYKPMSVLFLVTGYTYAEYACDNVCVNYQA